MALKVRLRTSSSIFVGYIARLAGFYHQTAQDQLYKNAWVINFQGGQINACDVFTVIC